MLDLGLALRSARRRGPRCWPAIGIAGVLVATVVVDVTRFEPTTTGHLRVAMLQGDDEQLPLAEQINQPLTEKHFALAEQPARPLRPHRVPRGGARHRSGAGSRRCGRGSSTWPQEHDAAVLVNARTPGDDGQSRNTNLLYTPDGKLQGTYSKQHLVPFGEYVPWRDALSWLPELRQVPYDFEPGDTRTLFHVGRAPVRVGDLLRVGVRAARARRRARRRGGRSW